MNVLLLSDYPLQTIQLAEVLQHYNISTRIISSSRLKVIEDHSCDASIVPHPLSTQAWELLHQHLLDSSERKPIIVFGKENNKNCNYDFLRAQCIFLNSEPENASIVFMIKNIMGGIASSTPSEKICIGEINLDRTHQRIYIKGKYVPFTKKEFFLMELFMLHPETILSKERIAHYVWDKKRFVSPNTIEVYVCRIRKKIQAFKVKASIKTISCMGYELTV